jgi:hypothetical protein
MMCPSHASIPGHKVLILALGPLFPLWAIRKQFIGKEVKVPVTRNCRRPLGTKSSLTCNK